MRTLRCLSIVSLLPSETNLTASLAFAHRAVRESQTCNFFGRYSGPYEFRLCSGLRDRGSVIGGLSAIRKSQLILMVLFGCRQLPVFNARFRFSFS